MTKKELLELYKNLHKVLQLRGVKFAYAVSKNISMLKPEIEAIEKSVYPKEDFIKLQESFEPERVKIAEKYSRRDDAGNPIKISQNLNGQSVEVFDMSDENRQKFSQECEDKLKEMGPDVYSERLKQLEEYAKLLEEEVIHVFHKVKIEDVPQEISAGQLNSIMQIIAE